MIPISFHTPSRFIPRHCGQSAACVHTAASVFTLQDMDTPPESKPNRATRDLRGRHLHFDACVFEIQALRRHNEMATMPSRANTIRPGSGTGLAPSREYRSEGVPMFTQLDPLFVELLP